MIVPMIDLRQDHGEVRDQGTRPTCLAFALSDLNGHRHQQPSLLSAEYLYREAAALMLGWKPHDGLDVHAAMHAVGTPGQTLESLCPYLADEPELPLAANIPSCPMYSGAFLMQPPTLAQIEIALSANRSIGLVVRVTPEFYSVDPVTAQVAYSPNVMPGMSHSILVVGMGKHATSSELHILVRNSWGAQWGDAGHAWLPEQYVTTHALCAIGD